MEDEEEVVEEERVEDKKRDNGREEVAGYEGAWGFLNMPLWSMRKRKSEMGRGGLIEMGDELEYR